MKRVFLLLGLALTATALACCVASNGSPVQLTNEDVVIVWDAEHGMEHFIRKADFRTQAKDFGFIVPTPTVPEMGVADPAAFRKLADLVPRMPAKGATSGAASTRSVGDVEVIRTEQVGDYDATVVRATDGKAMNAWLKKNGYISRPAMEEWLDYYTKQQWYFTAFKFVRQQRDGTETKAVRLSFKTSQPRYPYKMPKDTWPQGWRRPMNLFFIASSHVASKYVESDKTWEAREMWSGDLPESLRGPLAKDLTLKESDLPENAVVTIFNNGKNPDGYEHDLYFTAASGSMPVAPFVGGAAVLLLAGIYVARRKPVSLQPAQ